MSIALVLSVLFGYFGLLVMISWITSRGADNDSYFLGNKRSPWIAVAFGMIGDSLSGVTFISVPGNVHYSGFQYMQLVIGYFFGYLFITQVLLPLYYRMNLTSIYSYLRERIGPNAERTGSIFFLLSRLLGAGGRLYLAAMVFHTFVIQPALGPDSNPAFSFILSVTVIIGLILAYTYKGGIKTLVWTDVLQSSVLLLGVILSIVAIQKGLKIGFGEMVSKVAEHPYSAMFNWDILAKGNFFKMFIGGALTAIAMTGLDQNMMQKNLSCKSLPDAQKNIRWFSVVLIVVNLFFLALGVLLYIYYAQNHVDLPLKPDGKVFSDKVFPNLALNYLGDFAGLVFVMGLAAATFSSADSVLTTLTTSFYIDILRADKNEAYDENQRTKLRQLIHIAFAILLLLVIVVFYLKNDNAIIDTILMIAGYTYGPLLGLFAFGLYTKRKTRDNLTPIISLVAPVICYILSMNSKAWFGGYEFGYELLGVNGLLVFLLLLAFSKKDTATALKMD
jgi:SSS family transporter